MRISSIKVDFLPVFRKNKRLRPLQTDQLANKQIKIRSNIIEKFEMRPSSVSHLCLFEFAAMYTPVCKKEFEQLDKDLNCEDANDIEVSELDNDRIVVRDKRQIKRLFAVLFN